MYTWTPLVALVGSLLALYVAQQVRKLRRENARLLCQLSGHGYAEFKGDYATEARCPRCQEVIRGKAPESTGDGLQSCEDTVHQRLNVLEQHVIRIGTAVGIQLES